MSHRLYSAVVDPHGAYPMQAQRLLWSLTHLAKVQSRDVLFHVVGVEGHAKPLQPLRTAGVQVVETTPGPLDAHPWCRKLRQLDSLDSMDFTDVVLLDCDIIVLEPPPAAEGHACGKVVDFENPAFPNLKRLFEAAGLAYETAVTDIDQAPTVRGNVNGGVYVIDRRVFTPLAAAWLHWAEWCLGNREMFADRWMHIDQVAFAMAVASERIPFRELHRRYNVPTHVPQGPQFDCDPAILHYHAALDTQQLLLPVHDLPLVNAAITRVNDLLVESRGRAFDNAAFWNARYAMHPELGSGIGSRGETLAVKRHLLNQLVTLTRPAVVLDIAGGDGETVRDLPEHISVEATDLAASSRSRYLAAVPRAQWSLHDICQSTPPSAAELYLCLDVLIHLNNANDYHAAVRHICLPGIALIASGFDAPPVEPGPMTWFHEPLSRTLSRMGRVPIPIGSYRGLTVFFCPALIASTGVRDLQPDTLSAVLPLVSQPLLLIESLLGSSAALGFFPNHAARLLEYPWVLEQLGGHSPLRILDAGAGVSVLPILLADRGHAVITVDNHPLIRNGTPREHWNEWGFLDYGELRPNIRSLHAAYETIDPHLALDAVVSVSVIEHLPAATRLSWLAQASRHIVPGGWLLLTVDTVPFSDALWNYSEGAVVEAAPAHGTVATLLGEITAAGFTIERVERSPWLPQSRVGIARIRAVRCEKSFDSTLGCSDATSVSMTTNCCDHFPRPPAAVT